MECPKCGSQDSFPSPVNHRRGINEGETSLTGTSASGRHDAHDELSSVTKTQTRLPKDATPRKHGFVGPRGILIALIIAYFVSTFVARAVGLGDLGIFGPIMVIVILGTAVWLFISYPQRPELREAQAERERSWVCNRCKTTFVR